MRVAHLLAAAALIAAPALARSDQPATPPPDPSPSEIVAAAPKGEWVAIDPDDLLMMDLAPPAPGPGQAPDDGKPRRVVIQLIPAPFSETWTANIRTLAKAGWWNGLAIVRAQDNYVVQWGDPDAEDAAKAKPLPKGMRPTTASDYTVSSSSSAFTELRGKLVQRARKRADIAEKNMIGQAEANQATRTGSPTVYIPAPVPGMVLVERDPYAPGATFATGWPVALAPDGIWPVHCYGTVGVGRGMSPDAGSGAELYTVIGHAPRHLDRNIAVVGRVIEGIEHLSTLPRGTEALGFYKTPQERTPIVSIRMGGDVSGLSGYQYLSTESETFARYAEARANRRDPFFIVPAGGADVCNIPVPVRRAAGD